MKKLIVLILGILLLSCKLSHAASQWAKTEPLGTRSVSDVDYYLGINNEAIDRLLANYRSGVKLKYSSVSSVTIQTGEIVCSNSGGDVRRLRKNTSELSTSWSVATNGLDSGAEASSTTYYIYAVCDADAETFTSLVSTNSSAPSGATYYKRLGYFTNNSSSDIESVTNDNENSIVATGTITGGSTISLPSGYSTDECNYIASVNDVYGWTASAGTASDVETNISINSSRVVTCRARVYDTNGTARDWHDRTCNYLITCYR